MTKIGLTVGTYEAPSEVWSANIDGAGEKKPTSMTSGVVSEIGITKTERLKWKSNDGTEIEGWLTYPYGYDRSKGTYPLALPSHQV
jgi:dipeptidyl aminopeptidase/acylaminoacyl peptidase